MAITISDIKIGTIYNFPANCGEHREPCRVTKITRNANAGRPCYDMWGGMVWAEPAYSVEGIGLQTGRQRGFTVQSDTQDLTGFIAILPDIPEKVMDTTNAHDKRLVEQINTIWRNPEKVGSLLTILTLIANRDNAELVDKGIIQTYEPMTNYKTRKVAREILMQVCDDLDLQTIIAYCREVPDIK